MSRNKLIPLNEYPYGLFCYKDTICFKNEYNEAFIVSSGEFFCRPQDVLILPISSALTSGFECTYGKIYKQLAKQQKERGGDK